MQLLLFYLTLNKLVLNGRIMSKPKGKVLVRSRNTRWLQLSSLKASTFCSFTKNNHCKQTLHLILGTGTASSATTLSITTPSIKGLFEKQHKCHSTQKHSVPSVIFDECRYAKCRVRFIVMLKVVILSVIILSVVMLNVVKLSAIGPI
jgi:hypothetical protein